jgi:methylated-DNA-[protein]-cysteine S-methyltransferase
MPVEYSSLETPLGAYYLAATRRGLCCVERVASDGEFEAVLASKGIVEAKRNPSALEPHVKALREYFAGRRRRFDLPVDIVFGTAFDRKVWDALREIPFGEVRSYGWLAARIGRPGAARAVGAANGRNPVAIVIPCHRVVQADGGLGGYTGGIGIKAKLLELEGLRPPYTPQAVPRRRPIKRLTNTTRVMAVKTRSPLRK